MDPNYGGRTEWEDQMIRLGHMNAPEPAVRYSKSPLCSATFF